MVISSHFIKKFFSFFSLLIFLFLSFYGNSQKWNQIGSDIDGKSGTLSGFSISMSGDGTIVAIGAPENNDLGPDDYGSVRIYKFENNTFVK